MTLLIKYEGEQFIAILALGQYHLHACDKGRIQQFLAGKQLSHECTPDVVIPTGARDIFERDFTALAEQGESGVMIYSSDLAKGILPD
ncbi:hypothetical protein [Vogesella sp. XCS3]|uniref:hypothetical protein n=1 Tax=Vogesella sp. XCS3 TaxID=2877939 RepID=UPI001D0B712A|nr:hypothetical protein [Vogesella sp. XCS3]UDM18838.1 hypothetical protein LCH97_18380 [Vogesella sp. XCS3]